MKRIGYVAGVVVLLAALAFPSLTAAKLRLCTLPALHTANLVVQAHRNADPTGTTGGDFYCQRVSRLKFRCPSWTVTHGDNRTVSDDLRCDWITVVYGTKSGRVFYFETQPSCRPGSS